MKHDSHYSLAVLIPMVIWGGTLPVQAADGSTPDDMKKSETAAGNDDETMVVTAAAPPIAPMTILPALAGAITTSIAASSRARGIKAA